MAKKTVDPLQRVDAAIKRAEMLATELAPLLKKLRIELARDKTRPKDQTASYILLVAAAGFFTEEEGDRKISAPKMHEVADALTQDFIPGFRF